MQKTIEITLKLKYRADEYRADVQPVRAFAALPLDLNHFPACTWHPRNACDLNPRRSNTFSYTLGASIYISSYHCMGKKPYI